MEVDENNEFEEQEEGAVEIYSKNAIFWFSVLAAPLFGGILLALNLKNAGYKKAMYWVIAFSIIFTVAADLGITAYLSANKININVYDQKLFFLSAISIALNITGAVILTQFFFKKYFPDDDYYPKSILTPLLVTILIILALRVLGLGAGI